jgi:hypothetical protein
MRPSLLYPNTPYLGTATATATDSYTGTTPAAVLSAREDTYWRPANASGSKMLTIDLGAARIVDALGLVGEGLSGAVLTLETSLDGASWSAAVSAANLFSPVNAAHVTFTSRLAQHLRLTFSAFGSTFRVAWVCACDVAEFPYFEQDYDPENVSEAGEAMTSPGGLYLGNLQWRTMRELSLAWGTLLDGEMVVVRQWVEQCIRTGRPFLLVPDLAGAEVYFCWQEKPKFSAPRAINGLFEIEPIKVLTRAA